MTVKKEKKQLYLSRPKRVMIRFNDAELKSVNKRAKQSRLSREEWGRRKMLDIPIADVASKETQTAV